MFDTVLIAAPDRLATLTTRDDLSHALAFPDSDVDTALDTIAHRRPRTVALERGFAETPDGLALINRLRTDPSLGGCVVRIVSVTRDGSEHAPSDPVASVSTAPATLNTRRVTRFEMAPGVPFTLDGNPATLINLSVAGAQVLATATLKPNQRVRLALLLQPQPIRLMASVKWAIYEMSKQGPRFRAGLAFLNADATAVTRFIETHRL